MEEELENIKSKRNMLGDDFDKKLELIQKKMGNTNKKNEELLKNKTQEFNKELEQKIKIIRSL